jgi:hypothetical protein
VTPKLSEKTAWDNSVFFLIFLILSDICIKYISQLDIKK